MDSDDYSVPDRFKKQFNVIKKNPDLAVVGAQVAEFYGNIDNIIGYRKVPSDNETISQFIKWRNPFNHPTVVINKKVLDKVGGYLPFCNLEDYYLWARIIGNHYQVFNLPDVLTYMRVDNGLYSRRGHLRNLLYFYKS